jgi:hypothetical protein
MLQVALVVCMQTTRVITLETPQRKLDTVSQSVCQPSIKCANSSDVQQRSYVIA